MAQGAGGIVAAGVLGTPGAALLAAPARADTSLDVQILQTASSLEALVVATYAILLGEGPEGPDAPAARALAGIAPAGARETLTALARETLRQHQEHKRAFQARTTALDANARIQDAPNPKFLPLVQDADLSAPDKVVELAALLEKVATDTYLVDLTMLQDTRSKALVASVMAVEAQHLAALRLVGALFKGATPGLVGVPFPASDLMELPPATGRVAFDEALHRVGGAELVAEPRSGAVG